MPISNEVTKAINNHLRQYDSTWDELDEREEFAERLQY